MNRFKFLTQNSNLAIKKRRDCIISAWKNTFLSIIYLPPCVGGQNWTIIWNCSNLLHPFQVIARRYSSKSFQGITRYCEYRYARIGFGYRVKIIANHRISWAWDDVWWNGAGAMHHSNKPRMKFVNNHRPDWGGDLSTSRCPSDVIDWGAMMACSR